MGNKSVWIHKVVRGGKPFVIFRTTWLSYFSINQQKFLRSNSFKIHHRHAVVEILSSDEEPEEFNTALE